MFKSITTERQAPSILYHAQTLFLFTSDQVLDTVIPGTIFGTFAAIAGPTLDLPAQSPVEIVQRLPVVWSWLWLMILQFCLQNQRHTNSIEEDAINKPWRPIPSGRIAQHNAALLLIGTYIVSGIISYHLDVLAIYLVWTALGTAYNDFGGGDHSGMSRNVFCGALFSCTFGGALSISLGPEQISYARLAVDDLGHYGNHRMHNPDAGFPRRNRRHGAWPPYSRH